MARGLPDAPRWAWAVMAVSVAAIVGMSYFASDRPEPPGFTAPASAADPEPQPTRILIVGDSYTGGSNEGGDGANGWPRLVAADLEAAGYKVEMQVEMAGGSGYVAPGPTDITFPQMTERAAAAGHDLVIFFGSRNDTAPGEEVQAAAEAAFATVRGASPDVALLVIGPPWVNDDPPANILADRDAVAAAAAGVGATFVDPLAEGWFTGQYESLIGGDGVHPTNEGHRYMADLIRPHIEERLPVPAAG